MAENGRLKALPDVLEQFIHLRAVSEATAEVDVISAAALSEQQLRENFCCDGKTSVTQS